ncbi:MAG: DinB family protein [Acidobacteria bacterium]|nr:DinB family protein [Acidobacteriota bacterium]
MLAKALHDELKFESAITRKFLELLPEDKLDWAPHPKSMKLGRLAGHLAELPGWGTNTIQLEQLDIMPVDGPRYTGLAVQSRAQALEALDANAAGALSALASCEDASLMQPWSLLAGGRTLMTMPRVAVLRGMVLSHTVHHRAQLGVYYRLLDIPVPATYGPSADEQKMPGQ